MVLPINLSKLTHTIIFFLYQSTLSQMITCRKVCAEANTPSVELFHHHLLMPNRIGFVSVQLVHTSSRCFSHSFEREKKTHPMIWIQTVRHFRAAATWTETERPSYASCYAPDGLLWCHPSDNNRWAEMKRGVWLVTMLYIGYGRKLSRCCRSAVCVQCWIWCCFDGVCGVQLINWVWRDSRMSQN